MKYGYLAVEGPHDLEFAARLLKPYGVKRVKLLSALDPLWRPLIPTKFPHLDDLLKRMPVPTFFASDTHSIAVDVVEGETNIVISIQDSLDLLDRDAQRVSSVGILLDADSKVTPFDRYKNMKTALDTRTFPISLRFPDAPGIISSTSPRCGMFILPDNQTNGTLETLLIECARQVYPTLEAAAQAYISAAWAAAELNNDDRREYKKPAGPSKALIATIASMLRPGRALQVSLQDNRWFEEPLSRFPRVIVAHDFLCNLFDIQSVRSP